MFNQHKLWQKALLILLFIFLVASFVFVSSVEARSGCCSHHGGVCTYTCPDGINFGHYCCDGTSLSSTCAPYYSNCPVILLTPQLIPELVKEPTPPKTDYTILTTTDAEVTRIIDGDTIEVKFSDGTTEKVRLIGIDTPETLDPRKPVECFGKEATSKMKELVENKLVKLEKKAEENRDSYDRLLRYVYVGDLFVNAEMIKQGYAYAYTKYPFDSKLMEEFKQYENEARKNEVGLWSPDTCAGVANPVVPKIETPKDIPNTEAQKNNGKEWLWILLGITITGSIAWALLKRKANNV